MLTRRWLLSLMAGACTARADTAHEVLQRQAADAPLRMIFKGRSAADFKRWQTVFREKLAELLGHYEPPNDWSTTVESVDEFDDHRRELLILKADGHPDLPVYRLTPKRGSGPRPGIAALHGHGAFGHDSVVGIDSTPERKQSIESANYDYGRQLVRRGYVVTAPCFTPFGRRLGDRSAYGGDDPCAVTFVRMQLLGKVLIGENLRDAMWAVSLLAKTDGVDADRLGCVGLSYGGRMTMLTAAMDGRIRVAVISGALNMMQERMSARYSCGAQVIPGLLEYGDVPEIGALIAPRPCVWEIGKRDPLMVKDWIEPGLDRIRPAYKAAGAPENLHIDHFDGHHRWNGTVAYGVLDRALAG